MAASDGAECACHLVMHCRNMADDVNKSENDKENCPKQDREVVYSRDSLNSLSKQNLQNILGEFRKKKSGRKEVLIERILQAQQAVHCQCDDCRRRHDQNSIDFSALGDCWSKDLSQLPTLTVKQVSDYFENDQRAYDCGKRSDKNNLEKACSLFRSNFVTDVQVTTTVTSDQQTTLTVVKGKCKASMKSTNYQVFVALENDGSVVSASCQCTAGKGESCCHAGALMLMVIELKSRKCSKILGDSCTSQLSQWQIPGNLSSKKFKRDVPLGDVIIAKPSINQHLKPVKRIVSDVLKSFNTEKCSKMMKIYTAAYSFCPAARYVPRSDPSNDVQCPMPTEMKDFLEDFQIAPSLCRDIESDDTLVLSEVDLIIDKLFKQEPIPNTEKEIDSAIREYTFSNVDSIMSATSEQSDSNTWHKERSIRITSSNFGMIRGYKGEKEPVSHIGWAKKNASNFKS